MGSDQEGLPLTAEQLAAYAIQDAREHPPIEVPRPRDRASSRPVTYLPREPEKEDDVFRLDQPCIITLDGPAGTGKSTVARELARRLGLDFLDTGAMYRAAAAIALDRGIALDETGELLREVREADIAFKWDADPPLILAYGESVHKRIRERDVTAVVSAYAGNKALREFMVERQRAIAREHPRLVTEGRDQGSVVFPDAKVKFYLDASPAVRAQRRGDQLRRAGVDADLAELQREIEARDASDRSRAVGPLVLPTGAIVIDTSAMDVPQVVQRLFDEVIRQSKEATKE